MEHILWMEPQKPSRVPVINGGVMGWVLNQCKAEEEAGGRRGWPVVLLEKPGLDLYLSMNLEYFNHL